MEITSIHAEKIVELIDHGLVSGRGRPKPGKMCVEAVVCYALDLPYGDDPGCVLPSLRRMNIRINDSPWASNAARAAGMKRLALAQLGTAELDSHAFRNRIAKMLISKIAPRVLRNAKKHTPSHADRLEAAAARLEADPTAEAASDAAHAAADAAIAADDAFDAAIAAADAAYAASEAAHTTSEAAYAAYAVAHAPASTIPEAAANRDIVNAAALVVAIAASAIPEAAALVGAIAASANESDIELAFLAEEIVQVLVEMKAPGCQWLYLASLAA